MPYSKIVSKYQILLTLLVIIVCLSNLNAQHPDDMYWTDGFFVSGLDNHDEGSAIGIFDGNLIVGGSFEHADGYNTRNIAQWNGAIWEALGSGLDTSVHAIAEYNGDLYVGGYSDLTSTSSLAKWDGNNWTPFGNVDGNVRSLIVFDGELYIGGSISSVDGMTVNNVASWNGVTWDTLSSGLTGGCLWYSEGVYDMTVFNNNLIIGGSFKDAGTTVVNNIASWNGTDWSALEAGIYCSNENMNPYDTAGFVNTITVFNNKLYAGGEFSVVNGDSIVNIAEWDGFTWNPVNLNYPISRVDALIEFNSILYIAASVYDSIKLGELLAWDGSSDSIAGGFIDSDVKELIEYNSELIVMGRFRTIDNQVMNGIASFDGIDWNQVSSESGNGISYRSTGDGVSQLYSFENDLYAIGGFRSAGDQVVSKTAKWDGFQWGQFDVEGDTVSLLGEYNNELFAVCRYDSTDGYNYYYGLHFIKKFNGLSWDIVLPASSFTMLSSFYYNNIYDMIEFENNLIIAGSFIEINNDTVNSIARWDGISWEAMDKGLTIDYGGGYFDAGQVENLEICNGKLYAIGNFTHANGTDVNDIVMWDDSVWVPIIHNIENNIRESCVYNNKLFVTSSSYDTTNWVSYPSIYVWDGIVWDTIEFYVGDSGGYLDDIIVHNNELYVTGDFTQVNGETINNIAKWNGVTWSPLGSGIKGEDVNSMIVHNDELVVGGDFSTVGNKASSCIAFWSGPQTFCCIGIRGNIDSSPDDISDISDLVFLVDYMFKGGPAPLCFDEANVTGANDPMDIAELVYLVDYMFKGGPEPISCP